MKTNKAEREAIASKFIKRMEEKLVLKTQELSKSKGFKEIQKNNLTKITQIPRVIYEFKKNTSRHCENHSQNNS